MRRMLQQERSPEILDSLSRALEQEPNLVGFYERGQLHVVLGRADDVEGDLARMLAMDPECAPGRLAAGPLSTLWARRSRGR